MKRRHFLTALPLAACLAGCARETTPAASIDQPTRNQSQTDTGTRTPATEESTTRASTGQLTQNQSQTDTETRRQTVTEPSSISIQLRSSYRYAVGHDGLGVKSPEYEQFAFVTPPVSEEGPTPSAFRLLLGDEQFSPASSVPGVGASTPGIEEVYTTDSKKGSLMFDIPTVETENAAVLFDGTRYPLTEDARQHLATAPELSLDSVSSPESVAPTENVELSITVTNDGDAAGTYLAGFRTSGLPQTIDVPVEQGETGTGSVTYDVYVDSGSMYFYFTSPGGRRDYEVTIESAVTTRRS